MLQIHCPICNELRSEEEFHYKGQAHIIRPQNPDNSDDEMWGRYLFFRKNTSGIHLELWHHSIGCRKFFHAVRDTISYEILATYKLTDSPPTDYADLYEKYKSMKPSHPETIKDT